MVACPRQRLCELIFSKRIQNIADHTQGADGAFRVCQATGLKHRVPLTWLQSIVGRSPWKLMLARHRQEHCIYRSIRPLGITSSISLCSHMQENPSYSFVLDTSASLSICCLSGPLSGVPCRKSCLRLQRCHCQPSISGSSILFQE